MRYGSIIGIFIILCCQSSEVKLGSVQAKITTVSAMRVRSGPQASAQEITRLKLGTVVNVAARSANQDTIGDKTDYWYQVSLPNGQSGWLFGGLLLDWNLETKYHTLPIADRIAWAAVENLQPHDCEGDEVCDLFTFEGGVEYLRRHPNGAHAAEAVKTFDEMLTDDVIQRVNDKGGDQYAVEERVNVRKLLSSLRIALAKSSVAGKTELLKKLDRVTR